MQCKWAKFFGGNQRELISISWGCASSLLEALDLRISGVFSSPVHCVILWFQLISVFAGFCSGCAAQGGSVRTRVCLLMLPLLQAWIQSPKPAELLCLLCFQSSSVHTESAGAGVSCCFGGYYQEMLTLRLPLFSTSHHHTWRINLWNTIWSSQPCTSPAQLFNIPQPCGSWSAFSAPSLAQFRSHWGSSWP